MHRNEILDNLAGDCLLLGNWQARTEAHKESTPKLIRVTIDIGVLIRYLIRLRKAIRVFVETWWLENRLCVVTAPELIAPFQNVPRREHVRALIDPEDRQALLEVIHSKAEMLPPLGEVPRFTSDPKHDKFVTCALMGSVK